MARIHDLHVQWKDVAAPTGMDWTKLDAIVASLPGKTLCYPIYGVPAALSASSAPDAYNIVGAQGPAADPAMAAAFAVAVVQRFPQITLLETWNETQAKFWGGSQAQLVAQSAAIYKAVKAARPAVTVLSPAFTGSPIWAAQYLSAFDPATGLYGWQTFDAISTHPYGATVANDGKGLAWSWYSGVERLRMLMSALGLTIPPLYVTEWGIASNANDPALAAFLAMTPTNRQVNIIRFLLRAAVLGVKSVMLYSHRSGLCGDLVGDTAGSIAGANYIGDWLAGKTLISVQEWVSGSLVAVRADGAVGSW